MRTAPFVRFVAIPLLAGQALAQTPLPVANPGFELPPIAAGTFATTAPPPGWQIHGSGVDLGFRTVGVLDPTGTTLYPGGAPEGENVGVVFLLDDPGDQTAFANLEAGLEQTLASLLEPDTRYRLRVCIGNIADDPDPPHDAFQFAGFPGYRVELVAGGVPIASDPGTLLPGDGAFATLTLTVDVGATHPALGQPLGIRLVNRNAAPGLEVNFDDVRLESEPFVAVPAMSVETSALLLGGVLVVGLLVLRPGPRQRPTTPLS